MSRVLIALGVVFLAAGLLWPLLSRLGLGRLPGDIIIERGGTTIYIPLMTCFLASLMLSAVLWLVGR